MSAPVLVTGGAGSMGRLVVARLRDQGRAARVFDLPDVDYTGLEGLPGIELSPGSLTEPSSLERAVDGVGAVIHLAAILPPTAERDRDLTFRVNVEGTRLLLRAVEKLCAPDTRFVFSSSVSVYGDTSQSQPPVGVGHPLRPDDVYAESKAEAERLVRASPLPWVVLRISGVAIPVFQEPPAEWPFLPDQRIEFVHRDDAVSAIVAAATASGAERRVFNISGGPSWRMTGERYVADYFGRIGVDMAEAVYQDHPGHFDHYDSEQAEAVLRYRGNPYESYLRQIDAEIERLLAE